MFRGQFARFSVIGLIYYNKKFNKWPSIYKEACPIHNCTLKVLSGHRWGTNPHTYSWWLSGKCPGRLEVTVYTVHSVLVYTRAVSWHLISCYISKNKENWIEGGGDKVSLHPVHYAVTFLDCCRSIDFS